jgi:hypothetical protein
MSMIITEHSSVSAEHRIMGQARPEACRLGGSRLPHLAVFFLFVIPLGGLRIHGLVVYHVWTEANLCAESRCTFLISLFFKHHSCTLHTSEPSCYGESLARSQPPDPGSRTQDTGHGSAWSESPLVIQFSDSRRMRRDLNPNTTNWPWPISSHDAIARCTAVLTV